MDLGGINNKLKKFIFYIILIAITFSFIEFGSWSTIKVYQLIKHPKKNTDIQAVISEMHTVDGQSPENFKVNQPTREVWKQSTLAVYPKIKELAKSLDCFNDLTNIFKKDYYLDFCCHVTSEGNKIISKKIINILFKT